MHAVSVVGCWMNDDVACERARCARALVRSDAWIAGLPCESLDCDLIASWCI